jgi:hypothetical protein
LRQLLEVPFDQPEMVQGTASGKKGISPIQKEMNGLSLSMPRIILCPSTHCGQCKDGEEKVAQPNRLAIVQIKVLPRNEE